MRNLLHSDSVLIERQNYAAEGAAGSFSLLQVLWWRRWTVMATTAVCILLAALYVLAATRVYRATATLLLDREGSKVTGEGDSEAYLETEQDVLRSVPVLSQVLDQSDWRTMKTFSKLSDPISWLRDGTAYKIEAPKKKSNAVILSMESPYSDEAVSFLSNVIAAYTEQQSKHMQGTGREMVKVLEMEKNAIDDKREIVEKAMVKCKQESGVLSFRDDRSNTVVETTAILTNSLTTAQVATIELRAQYLSMKAALGEPGSAGAFVLAQSLKGRESEDREYSELHSKLVELTPALASSIAVQGPDNPRVKSLQSTVFALKTQIAQREHSLAEAYVVGLTAQVTAAEEKERELRTAVDAQWNKALVLNPAAARYARLEADQVQLQKQRELLDQRISEINVSKVEATPLNIQVLNPARAGEKAIKPQKLLTLAVALLAGGMLGIGLAMAREWQDARIRTPEEIHTRLGMPIVAVVPRINARLSSVARGQVMQLDSRSLVAEAYRSARTSLHLGVAREAKKILVTSPGQGDGKSTTASNLAIAFAQSGLRTVLVDCDLRGPVQHLIFEVDGEIGLTDVMAGAATLRAAVKPTQIDRLHVLPCGPVPINPSELLGSERFQKLMEALEASFDRIVIDSPPLATISDARIIASSADATLLVFRMNQSMRKLAAVAVDALEKVGANVLGAIANDVAPLRGSPYYGGAWQYAQSSDHLIGRSARNAITIPAREISKGATNGNGSHLVLENMLVIQEPDWNAKAS